MGITPCLSLKAELDQPMNSAVRCRSLPFIPLQRLGVPKAVAKSVAFSAPDTLRLLAGFDAATVVDRKLLKIFWDKVAQKQVT